MLGTVGFYLYDAAGLSQAALIFPGALIGVIVLGVAWAVGSAFLRPAGIEARSADDPGGPILAFKPWALVALPAALVFLQPWIGALPAMTALVFGAQLALGARRPLRTLAIAIAVTVPVYVLFAHFLYVRFPTGLLGIG